MDARPLAEILLAIARSSNAGWPPGFFDIRDSGIADYE
jgi:hypothetical protein